MRTNIKPATIARIGALLVALANQFLIMFGQDVLPFTEDMTYQVISLIVTVIISAINAWYNNDVSETALLCGRVFDALSDGKITEEEIEKILADAEDTEKTDEVNKNNFIISFFNNIIESLKSKVKKR